MCEPPPFAIRGCDVSDKIKFGRGGRKPAVPGADPVAPDTGQRPIPRSPAQALRPDGGVEPPKRRRARAARSQVVVFANFLFTLLIMSMVALGGALYLGKLRFEQPGPLAAWLDITKTPDPCLAWTSPSARSWASPSRA